jgi:hypothetical protein
MDMDPDTAVLTMAASIPRAQSFTISVALIQGVLLDELDFSLTDGGELEVHGALKLWESC